MGQWVQAAKRSEIPADTGKCIQIEGQEIALFQTGGQIYALQNHCPHRGGPLAEGGIQGEEITCPWHGWSFNVKTGAFVHNPSIKAATFKVKEEGDEIWIEI